MRVKGSDFGVKGSDFGVKGSDFGVKGSDFGVKGSDFRVYSSGFWHNRRDGKSPGETREYRVKQFRHSKSNLENSNSFLQRSGFKISQ
jgi:hypothetical protein